MVIHANKRKHMEWQLLEDITIHDGAKQDFSPTFCFISGTKQFFTLHLLEKNETQFYFAMTLEVIKRHKRRNNNNKKKLAFNHITQFNYICATN